MGFLIPVRRFESSRGRQPLAAGRTRTAPLDRAPRARQTVRRRRDKSGSTAWRPSPRNWNRQILDALAEGEEQSKADLAKRIPDIEAAHLATALRTLKRGRSIVVSSDGSKRVYRLAG